MRRPESPETIKRLANLKAIAAFAGITVFEIDSDFGGVELVATRWSLTKSFRDLDELADWLSRVTGKSA